MSEVFDVLVIGAGPGGTQAAVSAAHQMRHVLLLDASKVSRRRGRAYWSKTVKIEDAPVFAGITGVQFAKALQGWTEGQPERTIRRGGEERMAGIRRADGFAMDLERLDDGHVSADVRHGSSCRETGRLARRRRRWVGRWWWRAALRTGGRRSR